ncbi:hypothetical protein NV379_22320 [Paenibacillus sp. N1-5-1-14]|nr:hypothetical protein [Paenibacillus radicibacter]
MINAGSFFMDTGLLKTIIHSSIHLQIDSRGQQNQSAGGRGASLSPVR